MKKCPYSELCGGCSLQGISYDKQLKKKEEFIASLLNRFAKIQPIIGMENPNNYRNKVQVSYAYDDYHRIIYGNYIPSTHTIVPIEDCMICDERAIKIINSIGRLINKYKISIFDERAYKGCMRHVLVRTSNTGEIMVVLVTGSFRIVKKELFIADLLKYNSEITTVVQNFNNKKTSMILSDKNTVLYGKGFIFDELCGYRFKISPNSFYQINSRQTQVLYNEALKLADFKGGETLIDAYCGTGTIGIIASKKVKEVIGVELNKAAVNDAIGNAKNNKVNNIRFICDDAGRYMEKLAKEKIKIDALILDPPRSGASEKFLKAIYYLKPKKIVYVSCGPESLRSNLISMTKNGYKVTKIQPVDMFPYTNHVECVVGMQRKDNK